MSVTEGWGPGGLPPRLPMRIRAAAVYLLHCTGDGGVGWGHCKEDEDLTRASDD